MCSSVDLRNSKGNRSNSAELCVAMLLKISSTAVAERACVYRSSPAKLIVGADSDLITDFASGSV